MAKTVEEQIISEFGKGILTGGQSIIDSKCQTIPVSPGLDMILGGGIPEGSFVVMTGLPKSGKAQKLDSIIYTKDGPITMGNIKIGDILCHPKGGFTTVTNIFPQGLTTAYKITFSDGASTVCCGDHLWKVKTRFTDWKTLSTKAILKQGLLYTDRYKWLIPLTEPVSFTHKDVDLDPYMMGLLLGDGSFRNCLRFTTTDSELVKYIDSKLDSDYRLVQQDISFDIAKKTKPYKPHKYRNIIRKYGLWNCSSHTKFIPREYLYNSLETRWALLQGLLDTDGSAGKRGNCEYSTVSLQLANDTKVLVQSLGGICKIKPRYTTCNNKKFKSFRLRISFNDNRECFRLQRKKDRCHKRTKKALKRRIVDICKLDTKIPTQCISVSSCDGLYLTDDFIVTHNTSLCLDFAGTAQNLKYACDIGRKEGRHIYFSNIEGRLKKRDILGMKHLNLDPDRFSVIGSQPGQILTAENYIDINERLINENPGDIFIIDSFSALCTEGERSSDISKRYRADAPVLLAKFCRRISNVIPINKSIVMGITHMIANQGMGMSQWSEASGRKIQYQADIKLKVSHFTPWEVSDSRVGQDVHWICETSALNFPPGGKFSSKFRYNHGIDKQAELVTLCVDLSIIKKGGAWYTLPNGEKFQGLEKTSQALKDDESIYEELNTQVRGMVGLQ